MFSLQTIFGKGTHFYGLLEAAAEAARDSTRALLKLVDEPTRESSLEEFSLARKREKDIAAEISQALVDTFVTPLEREDIEALGSALYKVPKAASKFADRYTLAPERVADFDFRSRAALLENAADLVVEMVAELRHMNLDRMKARNDRLQAIESEGDRLIVELYRDLYTGGHDAVTVMMAKDLFELLEKGLDRCRDAGNVVYQIVLKNN
ncbi:MAG: DUF47 family protein [Xanthomonadales bacterium]|nr:DUF47 family protein [Xanthomonadales bacterium]